MELLQSQVAILGLYIKDVRGDENCLYRSLADQLDGTELNFNTDKLKAIECLKANKDTF